MLNVNETKPSQGFRRMDDAERGTKEATNVDAHVGARLKMFRELRGLSQQALADAMGGITFQQVQKYENGANRIAPSRLHAAAEFLEVPIADFFVGLKKGRKSAGDNKIADVMAALQSVDGARVCKAFAGIKSSKLRAKIANVVETIAAEA